MSFGVRASKARWSAENIPPPSCQSTVTHTDLSQVLNDCSSQYLFPPCTSTHPCWPQRHPQLRLQQQQQQALRRAASGGQPWAGCCLRCCSIHLLALASGHTFFIAPKLLLWCELSRKWRPWVLKDLAGRAGGLAGACG